MFPSHLLSISWPVNLLAGRSLGRSISQPANPAADVTLVEGRFAGNQFIVGPTSNMKRKTRSEA